MQVTLKAAENWNLSLKPVLCPTLSRGYSLKHHETMLTKFDKHDTTNMGDDVLMSQTVPQEKTSTSGTNSLWSPCHALTKCVRKKNAKDPKIFKTNSIRSTVENPWKSASRWEHHHRGSLRQANRPREWTQQFVFAAPACLGQPKHSSLRATKTIERSLECIGMIMQNMCYSYADIKLLIITNN